MNLNDLIIKTSDWDQNAAVLKEYFHTEVYFELANVPTGMKDGPHTIGAGDAIHIQPVNVQGFTMALFCTTIENRHIVAGRVGGMTLKEAIEMVVKSTGLQGILLQSDKEDWVAFQKDSLTRLMNSQ